MKVDKHLVGQQAVVSLKWVLQALVLTALVWSLTVMWAHHQGVVSEVTAQVDKVHNTAQWTSTNCKTTTALIVERDALLTTQAAEGLGQVEEKRLGQLLAENLFYPIAECAAAQEVLDRNRDNEIRHKITEEYENHLPFVQYCRNHEACGLLLMQFVSNIGSVWTWALLAFIVGGLVMVFVFRSWNSDKLDLATIRAASHLTASLGDHAKQV